MLGITCFTIGDMHARYKQAQGYRPPSLGWDTFGLPAENAANQNRPYQLQHTQTIFNK